jgi:hypothetical protein
MSVSITPINDTLLGLTVDGMSEDERTCVLRALAPMVERMEGVAIVYSDEDRLRIRVKADQRREIGVSIKKESNDYLVRRQRNRRQLIRA